MKKLFFLITVIILVSCDNKRVIVKNLSTNTISSIYVHKMQTVGDTIVVGRRYYNNKEYIDKIVLLKEE